MIAWHCWRSLSRPDRPTESEVHEIAREAFITLPDEVALRLAAQVERQVRLGGLGVLRQVARPGGVQLRQRGVGQRVALAAAGALLAFQDVQAADPPPPPPPPPPPVISIMQQLGQAPMSAIQNLR